MGSNQDGTASAVSTDRFTNLKILPNLNLNLRRLPRDHASLVQLRPKTKVGIVGTTGCGKPEAKLGCAGEFAAGSVVFVHGSPFSYPLRDQFACPPLSFN